MDQLKEKIRNKVESLEKFRRDESTYFQIKFNVQANQNVGNIHKRQGFVKVSTVIGSSHSVGPRNQPVLVRNISHGSRNNLMSSSTSSGFKKSFTSAQYLTE